jgi:hypothetical protein
MSNDLKWMLSSDQQFPYHDPRAVDLWFKVMKWFKPDIVDYLGDTDDQACYSRWTEGRPTEFSAMVKNDFSHEIQPLVKSEAKPAREFYEQTRKMRPNAELFSALGNHDVRALDYFDKKLPDHAAYVTPEAMWGLDSLGYKYIHYNDRPAHRYGDIYVHHGMAISQNAAESVKKDCENFGVSMVRGHSHRIGQWQRTFDLTGQELRGWELGHMADVNCEGMGYTNVHNWQLGFAIGHITSGSTLTKDGYYPHIQVITINSDYECFVDGKKFNG